jgi:hypothetical protein
MSSDPAGNLDARLLRAVAAGDEPALRSLYERHATWLYARWLWGSAAVAGAIVLVSSCAEAPRPGRRR